MDLVDVFAVSLGLYRFGLVLQAVQSEVMNIEMSGFLVLPKPRLKASLDRIFTLAEPLVLDLLTRVMLYTI